MNYNESRVLYIYESTTHFIRPKNIFQGYDK